MLQEEAASFFSAVVAAATALDPARRPLAAAFAFSLLQSAAAAFAAQYALQLASAVSQLADLQVRAARVWTDQLQTASRLREGLAGIDWAQRDAAWLAALGGWRECVVEGEETVAVPGTCLPALADLLGRFVRLLDEAAETGVEVGMGTGGEIEGVSGAGGSRGGGRGVSLGGRGLRGADDARAGAAGGGVACVAGGRGGDDVSRSCSSMYDCCGDSRRVRGSTSWLRNRSRRPRRHCSAPSIPSTGRSRRGS